MEKTGGGPPSVFSFGKGEGFLKGRGLLKGGICAHFGKEKNSTAAACSSGKPEKKGRRLFSKNAAGDKRQYGRAGRGHRRAAPSNCLALKAHKREASGQHETSS